jgi:hypothetical protein
MDSERPWACGPPKAMEVAIVVTPAISPAGAQEHLCGFYHG